MTNRKELREQLLLEAGWREVCPGKWLPDGLYCFKCGKRSKPEDANNLQCLYCGGNLCEVHS